MSTQSPTWLAASRLVRRTGFGATGAAVDTAAKLDPVDYVNGLLAADFSADPGVIATPIPSFDTPVRPTGKNVSTDAAKAYSAALRTQMNTLSSWWLNRMAAVEQPMSEKLTFLWHGHFATSAQKVRTAASMAAQNETIRTRCLGDFHELASAMLVDAAMLRWLDGTQNTAAAPNENLAREFMELFTLGHGNGYTETDVREGARALTGWTIRDGDQVQFVAKRHDDKPKTVLGVTGDLDATSFCDAVLAAPASATFVAQSLWSQLASQTAPSPAGLDRLVSAYGPNRDLKGLTVAVLTDPEFAALPHSYVNTPVEWLVGLVRSFAVPDQDARRDGLMERTLTVLGQRPFYPPSVGGWPNGQAWLSTASAGTRFQAARELAAAGNLSTVEEAAPTDRIDAAGYLLGIGSWTDRSAAALKPLIGKPIDLVAAAANTAENLTS